MTASRHAIVWSSSLAVAVLVHLAAIAVVLWWRTAPPATADLAADAIMLDLAATPEAPPAPPTDMPQGPIQPPNERPLRAEQPRLQPRVELPTFDTPDVQDPDQALDEPKGPPSEKPMQAQAPPSADAARSTRLAARQTVSGVRGEIAATWQGILLGHLEQHRRYPRQAERMRQEGTAHVRFSVDQRGYVANARIERSSGNALLDQATLDTVQRASPVPPPPTELAPYPVDVMVPVEFYVRRR
ncbi:energy transducer TonB [Pseudoxanthomonas sp. PXM02]|uniref:energy transducer TonB family protein n=1 Tax=Pseudoxanthomonas sp. PXM02 TaxID=2769294 RepID=UPI001784D641|nr:energy transducer TonB [Pseudoxanthomonas sp. PXM02]MBD9479086.1 energy transducer TonB [Pseudoxanthomonas sp. PXM02]